MARITDRSARQHKFVCKSCRGEFFSYSLLLGQKCPYCGQRAYSRGGRWLMRAVALLLLLGLGALLLLAHRAGMLG